MKVLKLYLAALLLTGLAGCNRPASPPAKDSGEKTASGGVISAHPNPVPAGQKSTTITWDTGDGSPGVVHVSSGGAEEKLFAQGSKGSKEAPWIGAGKSYEFRLYSRSEPRTLLGSVTVSQTGEKTTAVETGPRPRQKTARQTGDLSTANQGKKGASAARSGAIIKVNDQSVVTWDTGDGSPGVVHVSSGGAEEKLFAQGSKGSKEAPWIGAGKSYEFRLYSGSESRTLLASADAGLGAERSATVPDKASPAPTPDKKPQAQARVAQLTGTARKGEMDFIYATPNPVPRQSKTGAKIVWDTRDGSLGQVYFTTRKNGPEIFFLQGKKGAGRAPWISGGHVYEFRLYKGRGRKQLLDTVQVRRQLS